MLYSMTVLGTARWAQETDRIEQALVPSAMGFVWDARIRVAPLLHVAVRDAYVGGIGFGRASLQSARVVSEEQDGLQLNTGELYRLAEAPWCPTLMLPGRGVTWAEVDGHRARATLTGAQTTAVVEFRFNDADEVLSVFAADRPRQYGTTYIPTPWEGRFAAYATIRGMRIPTTGEVGWWVDEHDDPVWHGTISDVDYR
jgi:hypothetical protein